MSTPESGTQAPVPTPLDTLKELNPETIKALGHLFGMPVNIGQTELRFTQLEIRAACETHGIISASDDEIVGRRYELTPHGWDVAFLATNPPDTLE